MNIYDIAKEAGVSTATISRVINNSKSVSQKTYEKVKIILEKNNFMPNQTAVGLATNSTKTIGIMVPDVRDSFHADVAYLIENSMMERHYNCILCNTTMETAKKIAYLNTLLKKNVDGIILVGSTYSDMALEEFYNNVEKKIPLVYINAIVGKDSYSVLCDEKYGLLKALEHLKKRGKKHPIFLKDAQAYQSTASERKEHAFIEMMKKVYGDDICPKAYSFEPTIQNYISFLKKIKIDNPEIDSVLFTNDKCSAIFLKAMEKLGLKAPADYALVGFNNSEITDLTSPTITTIDHEIKAHCDIAVEKLFALMENKEVEYITYIKPKLVVKETT